jgi:hypothetical protein
MANDIPQDLWEEALEYAQGEEDIAVILATASLESGTDIESVYNCLADDLF